MISNITLSKIFLLASIATTFIKIPEFYGFIRISDFFLFISFLFFLLLVIKKQISLKENKTLLLILAIFIGTNILGTTLSFIIFGSLPIQTVILNYARLTLCLVIFSEIILLSQTDKLLYKKTILCILGSLAIIPVVFILQNTGYLQYVMFDPNRFSGLLKDPNYFANFQIIPTLLLLFFVLKNNNKIVIKSLTYIGFLLSTTLILWSGSRSGILGLLVSVFVLLLLYIIFSKKSKLEIFTMLFLVAITLPISFMLIPKYNKVEVPITVNNEVKQSSVKVRQEARVETFSNVSNVVAGKDRLMIWKDSTNYITNNPFGYGPDYNNILNITGFEGGHRVVHNFELEMLLQCGIVLFVFFNYYFAKLLIRISSSPYFKEFNEMHVFIAIIIGIFASGLFLDLMPQKWVWIILALIFVYDKQKSNDTEISFKK